jgi:hypothetical protein
MTPSLLSAQFAVVCLALAGVLMALGAVWARLRALPLAETVRMVEDLARRQRDLEALLARVADAEITEKGSGADSTTARDGRASGAESAPDPFSAPRSRPIRRVDPAEPNAVTGPTLIAVPDMAADPAGPASASAELGRKFGAIWAMADAGTPAESIAQATGQPIGQVELILGLRRRLAGGSGPTNPRGRA